MGYIEKLSQKDFDGEARRVLGNNVYEEIIRRNTINPRQEVTRLIKQGKKKNAHTTDRQNRDGRLAAAGPD